MITSGFILYDLSVKQSQTPILLFSPVYCNILQKILSSKSKSPPPKKKIPPLRLARQVLNIQYLKVTMTVEQDIVGVSLFLFAGQGYNLWMAPSVAWVY